METALRNVSADLKDEEERQMLRQVQRLEREGERELEEEEGEEEDEEEEEEKEAEEPGEDEASREKKAEKGKEDDKKKEDEKENMPHATGKSRDRDSRAWLGRRRTGKDVRRCIRQHLIWDMTMGPTDLRLP